MRRIALPFALALPVLLFCPAAAAADPVGIGLTFNVQSTQGGLADIFGTPLSPGSTFTGLFTYDPTAPDTNPSPGTGEYQLNGQLTLNTATSLGMTASSYVYNDAYLYQYGSRCGGGEACDFYDAAASPVLAGFGMDSLFQVNFIGLSGARGSDALPATAAEFVAAFKGGLFSFEAKQTGSPGAGYSHTVSGFVTTEDVAVTPEPGSMLLLGTGLLGVFRAVRRRRECPNAAQAHTRTRIVL